MALSAALTLATILTGGRYGWTYDTALALWVIGSFNLTLGFLLGSRARRRELEEEPADAAGFRSGCQPPLPPYRTFHCHMEPGTVVLAEGIWMTLGPLYPAEDGIPCNYCRLEWPAVRIADAVTLRPDREDR